MDRRARLLVAERALYRTLRMAGPGRRRAHAQRHLARLSGPERKSSLRPAEHSVAWLGQGAIADRTKEHLGASDRGIILMRKRFLDDLEAIERGEDPKGLIRDPKENECIRLPIVLRDLYTKPHTRAELEAHPGRIGTYMRNYIFQAGQPDEVRIASEKALMIRI